MDKNLETGLLIGAGIGLAISPIIKKVAKSLPGAMQHLDKLPIIDGESKEQDESDSPLKFIPVLNAAEGDANE